MNRRGFLGTCLALGVAPAIVRADSLMRIVPRETVMLTSGESLDPFIEMLRAESILDVIPLRLVIPAMPGSIAVGDKRMLGTRGPHVAVRVLTGSPFWQAEMVPIDKPMTTGAH